MVKGENYWGPLVVRYLSQISVSIYYTVLGATVLIQGESNATDIIGATPATAGR